jgi:glutathione reductase (NADPH)
VTAYDLVVIGTGSSGNTVATSCARAGWRVGIVDALPYGGTCVLRGCDPKKVLVGAAELIDWCERMRGSGFSGEARIDWPALMRFKRTFTDPVPQQREESYRGLGIDTHHGPARFLDPATLSVGDRRLEARRIVLAAGARPASLGIAGEEHLITSTEFLDLDRLPPRIAFIGGGYIAFEFAHLAARAGAAPVILQRGPRVLTGFDSGLVAELVDVSREVGVEVRVQCDVRSVVKRASAFVVSGSAGGVEFDMECDLVVHAAGRVADLDDLDLEAGNVQRTEKGVAVNEFLQSRSNAAAYAVGDCADAGGLPLTPTASAEGEVAARNLLEGNHHSVDFAGLVSIVYTIPPLGSTGLTHAAAQERGLACTVRASDSTQWYSSRRIRARRSAFRVIVEDSSGRILGAHVLGPHAEELLNIFSLAIRAQIPAAVLEGALFGYPTASSDVADMLQTAK